MTVAEMLDRLEELAGVIYDGVGSHRTSSARVSKEIKAIVKRLRAATAERQLDLLP